MSLSIKNLGGGVNYFSRIYGGNFKLGLCHCQLRIKSGKIYLRFPCKSLKYRGKNLEGGEIIFLKGIIKWS